MDRGTNTVPSLAIRFKKTEHTDKMNWKEIEQKYPKSWKKLEKFAEKYGLNWHDEYNMWTHTDVRFGYDLFNDLEYFFDEQGIIIEICFYIKDFRVNIWGKGNTNKIISNYEVKYAKHFKSRKEAEEQAFMKAFEILENQIK